MAGDYFHWQAVNSRKIVDFDVTALIFSNPTLVKVKSFNHFLTIQKIVYSVGVYAAHTLTFSDSVTGQQIGYFSIPATAPSNPGSQEWLLDWALTGTQLAMGANLVLTSGSSGSIGRIHVESYERLGNAVAFVSGNEHPTVAQSSTPSNQM